MKFVAAFQALGYKLPNNQGWWSAENETGVCITLWQQELSRGDNGLPCMKIGSFGPGEWEKLAANTRRAQHIAKALAEFDGYVDVVVLLGDPASKRYGDADPWDAMRRGGRWRITKLDPSGRFAASIERIRVVRAAG